MTRFHPPQPHEVLRGADDDLAELARTHAMIIAGHVHERFVHRVGACIMINAGTLSSRGIPGFVVVDLDIGLADWLDVDDEGMIKPAESYAL